MFKKYVRDGLLDRPRIKWKKIIFINLSVLCASAIFALVVNWILEMYSCQEIVNEKLLFMKFFYMLPGDSLILKLMSVFWTIIGLIFLKKIMIFFVHLYQAYAPDSIRMACRFTPSCSQYMILSIEKYGAIKGCLKGLNRLSRCTAPNGGEDYP